MIDFDMRLGELVTPIVVAAGGLMVFAQMKAEAALNGRRLDNVERELAKQTDILVRLAIGDERMNSFERRISRLEQGEGT